MGLNQSMDALLRVSSRFEMLRLNSSARKLQRRWRAFSNQRTPTLTLVKDFVETGLTGKRRAGSQNSMAAYNCHARCGAAIPSFFHLLCDL